MELIWRQNRAKTRLTRHPTGIPSEIHNQADLAENRGLWLHAAWLANRSTGIEGDTTRSPCAACRTAWSTWAGLGVLTILMHLEKVMARGVQNNGGEESVAHSLRSVHKELAARSMPLQALCFDLLSLRPHGAPNGRAGHKLAASWPDHSGVQVDDLFDSPYKSLIGKENCPSRPCHTIYQWIVFMIRPCNVWDHTMISRLFPCKACRDWIGI